MRPQSLAAGALSFAVLLAPAWASDDDALTRLALCRDSWVDWQKSDPAKLKAFGESFRAQFSPHDNDPYFLPTRNVSAVGLRVTEAFPDSVGMGVGFSLTVDATFDEARKALETALGKTLQKCDSGEGMKNCEREIAPQRTVTLLSEDRPGSRHTLIGCYYFYEK